MVGNHGVLSLARKYGTPLHIVNERRLINTAKQFVDQVTAAYPSRVSVHYALKCNSVPGIVDAIRLAGLNAEVMTEYELDLAVNLGFAGQQIIVNGPCKTASFLAKCLKNNVRLIIVDSLQELDDIDRIARGRGIKTDILLRVNPDYKPRTVNKGTSTGTRKCAFGFDIKHGELRNAVSRLQKMNSLNFLGLHMHIGTGIRDPQDYVRALRRLKPAISDVHACDFPIRILDVGGGFASMTTREFTTWEMLASQTFAHLPEHESDDTVDIAGFAHSISAEVSKIFNGKNLPELLYEPGRCIASANQFLLLTVHRTKKRNDIGTWLVADGGLSTVTLPTYYEHHEVFLCDDINRPRTQHATLIGPACFAGDIIYKNKLMPEVNPGEVIAIMDSGAYFTALESSFGFPRPAILVINGAECTIVRARETYDDMISRDIFNEENEHEIRNHEKHCFSLVG